MMIQISQYDSLLLNGKFRLEILQKSKQEEMDRKKVEDRRRKERENVGGIRESWGVNKKEEMEEKVRKSDKSDRNLIFSQKKPPRDKPRMRFLFGQGVS